MDATLTTAALAAAETTIQRALRYDPGSRQAMGQLAGQVLALQFTQPELTIYILPNDQGLALASHWEGGVSARLTGKPWDFLRLVQGEQSSLAGSGVHLEGSTALVQELQRIARQLDIDWEEALSEVLGDVAGHQGAQWLRTGGQWLQAREAQARRLLGEFLTQEASILPSRPELDSFYQDLDELQMAVDRAEARLNQLAQRWATSSQKQKDSE